MDPLMTTIILFAGNFAPRGFAFCEEQTLNIESYTAVFSLLGTTYGGNGTTTFALPDLREVEKNLGRPSTFLHCRVFI
jgi:microcystin-dependent protein